MIWMSRSIISIKEKLQMM